MKKMWVRRSSNGFYPWEIGCQDCGHVVNSSVTWKWAIDAAWNHIFFHRAVA